MHRAGSLRGTYVSSSRTLILGKTTTRETDRK